MDKYRLALKCLGEHIEAIESKQGYTFATLACYGCDQKTFCEEIRRVTQKHLNYKLAVK